MKLLTTKHRGISYVKNKKGITYYHTYRDPDSKIPKRKKILSKDKHTKENAEECYELVKTIYKAKENDNTNIDLEESEKEDYNTNIVPEETDFKNYLTLNQLAEIYFQKRIEKKERIFRELNTHLTPKEFEEDKTIQRKLYNTKKEKLRFIKNVEDSELANRPVNKITQQCVNDFIEIHLANKSLTKKSKFNIGSAIKTIFNFSIKKNTINIKNPFESVKFENPKRNRQKALTEEEIKLLLSECKKYNYDQKGKDFYYRKDKKGNMIKVNKTFKKNYNIYLSVYFGVITAARLGSILNIKKKDIDLKHKTITLTNQKNKMTQYKVQLTDKAIDWLENKILPYYEPNEYLIRPMNPLKRQNPPQSMKNIPEEVYKIMDKLFNQGFNKQNNHDRDNVVNFHSIRRSIATNMAKQGTSLYNVMILLNHSSVEQTRQYLNTEHNKLNNDINKLMSNIFNQF